MQKILVVEDDMLACELLQIKLRSINYDVEVAHNGLDGIDIAKEFKPDLVILDQMMPAMSGNEFLTLFKKLPIHQSVPVIMLSARFQTEDIREAKSLGATEYITKPFAMPTVITALEKHLNGRLSSFVAPSSGVYSHGTLAVA